MAPKAVAERMKLYRQRMSSAKKQENREKNKLQQQQSRSKWTSHRKKQESAKSVIRKRQSRLKEINNNTLTVNTPSRTSPAKAFGSVQSLGRAVRRVKSALPNSPRKKLAVVKILATKFGANKDKNEPKLKEKSEVEKAVYEYYMSDKISWQMPGRKDYITVKRDGEKTRLQKKVLLCTVREAFRQFKEDQPEMNIAKSKFAALRPVNVVPVCDKDHNVCCCIYHENFELLSEGLRKIKPDLPSCQSLIHMSVCDPNSPSCYLGDCEKCVDVEKIVTSKLFAETNKQEVCHYRQWCDKAKEDLHVAIPDATDEFTRQLTAMRKHSFIAKTQLHQKKHLQNSLGADEIILQEDFSENFSIKQQNEIMSAHWEQNMVTIFTAVMSTQTGSHSYAVVSNELCHDKHSVVAFNRTVLEHAVSTGTDIQNVHFFSDGAGGQFKNRFSLSTLLQPGLIHQNIQQADWSFFATAHGKGPVDGVGGTVKRAVWRRILQQSTLVKSAKDFAVTATDACPNITVLYVGADETEKVRKELTDYWSQSVPRTIPQTRSLHYFARASSANLKVGIISPFIPTVAVDIKTVALFLGNSDENSEFEADNIPEVPGEDEAAILQRSHEANEQHKAENEQIMTDFTDFLSTKNFQLHGTTPSDGNCYFWALSDQLKHHNLQTYKHWELRAMVCDHLESLTQVERDELQAFVPNQDIDDYIQEMRTDGVYVDHIVVEYSSRMLGLPITVVADPSDTIIGKSVQTHRRIYIGYMPIIQHYVSVEPVPHPPVRGKRIEQEQYYAVDYVDRFYIGRVLCQVQSDMYKMKFLHQITKYGEPIFSWPTVDDIECVYIGNIFYGPVTLLGFFPEFKIPEIKQIQEHFQTLFRK